MTTKALALLLLLALLVGIFASQGGQQPQTAPRATNTATASERIVGAPTLSAAFIDQVLAAAHSPAQGLGQTLYQLSQRTHIDDAYALAFFHHESNYGLQGVATQTRSLGNIRCTQGFACDPTGGYRAYASYAAGAADWFHLIQTVYLAQGLDTIAKIIPKYAPAGDHNDEAAYIHSVLQDVTLYREGKVVL